MKTIQRFSFMAVLFLTIIACQALSGEETGYLFQDDFSDTSGGWAEDRTEGITDYEQGGYRIMVNQPSFYFWSTPGLSLTNVRIEVETTKLSGPDDNEFGIICRYQNPQNFYFLTISSDGYYGITKLVDDQFSLVGMDNLLFSENINQGENSKNTLRAECDGTHLRLYANGTLLAETTDVDLDTGDIGLIAGTFDESGTDILFDNLTVADPAP